MVFRSHEPVVAALREKTSPATTEQRRLARYVGIEIAADEPRLVAAARLSERLMPLINGKDLVESETLTERQFSFLYGLSKGNRAFETVTKDVASAWIDFYLSVRNLHQLQKLKLCEGDTVMLKGFHADSATGKTKLPVEMRTVSSISDDGLVYFKGGNGKCAYVSNLEAVPS